MKTEILLVSGDNNLLETGRKQLEKDGYYVTTCTSFNEAAELCRDQFAMVIVGQSLPDKEMQRFIHEVRSVCLSPILALRQGKESPVKEADYNVTYSPDSLQIGNIVDKLLTRAKAA
jgi:DNA-binding response OmpR family regulator